MELALMPGMKTNVPSIKPSPRFFFPKNGKLFSYSTLSPANIRTAVQEFDEKLLQLVDGTHFPRAMTRLAVKKGEYRIGVYDQLGQSDLISDLRNDLLFYQSEQDMSGSSLLTFIAIFNDSRFDSERAFEMAFWKHLSLLAGEKNFQPQINELDLRFNFDGLNFSVVNMHPMGSKPTRRFSKPMLIFNLYEQLEQETSLFQHNAPDSYKNENRFSGALGES